MHVLTIIQLFGSWISFIETVYYYYDLELDKNFQIFGGEWYNRDHPDFLWTPHYSTSALTSSDFYLLSRPDWDGKEALPEDIRNLAIYAARKGSPLAYIVNSLIKLAR